MYKQLKDKITKALEGFTAIELMIVIAIAVIVAAVATGDRPPIIDNCLYEEKYNSCMDESKKGESNLTTLMSVCDIMAEKQSKRRYKDVTENCKRL